MELKNKGELKNKEGFYITIGCGGIPKYIKKSDGNKLRLKEIIITKMSRGGYDNQSEPIIKSINDDFIRINDNNIIDSPLYEKNRELYNKIKQELKNEYR